MNPVMRWWSLLKAITHPLPLFLFPFDAFPVMSSDYCNWIWVSKLSSIKFCLWWERIVLTNSSCIWLYSSNVVDTGEVVVVYRVESLYERALLFLLPGYNLLEVSYSHHWNYLYIWKCFCQILIHAIFLFHIIQI